MSTNPYVTPASASLSPQNQAVWTKELKSARTILIVVGVLQILFGLFYLTQVKSQVEEASRKEIANSPGYVFDQQKFDEEFEKEKPMMYALASVPLVVGVFFLIMSALVFKFPVGVTLASLIVFVLVHAADAIYDPTAIARGIILKIIFLVVLWKAYQSAKKARATVQGTM
ncbi:MAG TPA: hypothetical protein VG796_18830 [Verrucomicrobiales bacterium]|jgi:hypothetical protein|nr:hypothetical protein [Verrucomicrobiales bacterium]